MKNLKKTKVRGKRDFPSREDDARDLTEGEEGAIEEERIPTISEEEKRCVNAKLYLLSQTTDSGCNMYDHLSHVIGDVLVDKPENAYRNLENISYDIKRERLDFDPSTILPHPAISHTSQLAHAQWKTFKKSGEERHLYTSDNDSATDEDIFRILPNIQRQSHFFEQAGAGLQREEFVRMSIALRDIIENWPILSIRFWGKILGTQRNYYVAETEFEEGEYESDLSDEEDDDDDDDDNGDNGEDKILEDGATDSFFDDISTTDEIKPTFKKEVKIPCEELGTGLNRKVYFVCSEPGLPWTRLPHITPAQMVAARKIKRFVTGNLDAPIVSYPPFPGNEINFVRAQIARISASTTISPIGYYRFDDQEEEEEAEEAAGGRSICVIDTEYDGFRSVRELADPTLQSWCHHVQSILPQGRNTWFNPVLGKSEDDGEESFEEDREEPDEPEPEVGPPLLSPLSEDLITGDNPAWIVKLSSKFVPEFSIVSIQSTTWPGSVTFGADQGKFFETLYVGWGVKNDVSEFDPCLPPIPLWEFPSGPEIAEADDPSPEEEAAMKAAIQDREQDEEDEHDGEEDDGADDDD